jgi:alpha-D-ribose 1-methylphosphonate 5-triphosphate synthase subunit PhnH
MTTLFASAPAPGFADPVFDAQTTFRALLDAMARPGTLARIDVDVTPPAPLSPAATAVALTLLDHDTTVWLDDTAAAGDVPGFLAFHCGSPGVATPGDAAFALIADPAAMPSLERFAPGTDAYPDGSTTLVIDLPSLQDGAGIRLTGPGIAAHATIAPAGLAMGFWDWMALNRTIFPLGADIVLTCGQSMTCLPRTTRCEELPCT